MGSGAQPPIGSTWHLGSVSEPRPPVGCSPRVRPFPPRPPPEVASLCSVASSVLRAAFVTRLQPSQLPGQAARQLPDQPTILWVESSSTSASRLRGARPTADEPERVRRPFL